MSSLGYVGRRLLQLIPVAIGVTLVSFLLIHLIPGDPARAALGIHATPRAIKALDHSYGLDRSLPAQYWLFLSRLVQGNFGTSLYFQVPAGRLIAQRIPVTLWLIAYTVVLVILISVPLAVIAASRKDGARDHVVRLVPLLGLGMPPFWIGLVLIELFAVKSRIFPVAGYGSDFLGHLRYLFLPSLTVAFFLSPTVIRSLRASMLNVLGAEYIVTAESKGLSRMRLLLRHVLRNAVIPTITVLGINIGFLIGTTVIIEQVFALPGIGQLMIQSIFNRDFTVVQGVTLVFAVMVVVINLLVDLTYARLDPRVKLG